MFIVGHRYYDRGSGGFMAGRGANIFEGRVVCVSYPTTPGKKGTVPEIRSLAGWGIKGTAKVSGEGEL